MLTFYDLSYLRLASKEFLNDAAFAKEIQEKRAILHYSIPTYCRSNFRLAKKLIAKLTDNTILCMKARRCEVCHKGCYARFCNFYSFMYGHRACIRRSFVARYLKNPNEQQAVLKTYTWCGNLTEKRLSTISRRFDKINQWLKQEKNSGIYERYGHSILRMACSSTMHKRETVLHALLEHVSARNFGRTVYLYKNRNYVKHPLPVLNRIEARGERIRNQRHQFLKWEFDFWQLDFNAHKKTKEIKYELEMCASFNPGLVLRRLVFDICAMGNAKSPNGRGCKRSWQWKHRRTTVNDLPRRLPWINYQKKRMRLWRGLARFVGIVRVQQKKYRSEMDEPTRKRCKL